MAYFLETREGGRGKVSRAAWISAADFNQAARWWRGAPRGFDTYNKRGEGWLYVYIYICVCIYVCICNMNE